MYIYNVYFLAGAQRSEIRCGHSMSQFDGCFDPKSQKHSTCKVGAICTAKFCANKWRA